MKIPRPILRNLYSSSVLRRDKIDNAVFYAKAVAAAEYCPESFIPLDAGTHPGPVLYAWTLNGNPLSNQQMVNASENGNYTVTVTNSSGCSTTKTVAVKKVDFPTITEIKIENNTVQIIAVGNGALEYSIDGSIWQTSNIFYNVPKGNYIAYVRRGLQPCAVTEKPFTIFNVNNVFSPNGDGVNDVWSIEGIENYPDSKIKVIDRFGTLVLDKTVKGRFSWNGEHLSRKLPTASYWYHITVSDGRILSGFVDIKNRD